MTVSRLLSDMESEGVVASLHMGKEFCGRFVQRKKRGTCIMCSKRSKQAATRPIATDDDRREHLHA